MGLDNCYTLNDGNEILMIGFGTWQMRNDDHTAEIVEYAIKNGYRHIDTAAGYKNEESVGKGIRNSGVSREDIFVTTKLGNDAHSYDLAKKAIDDSLERLGLDYIDLYLIHWPNPLKFRDHWQEANAETWCAMEEAEAEGKIKSLGVSNFMTRHLVELMKTAKVVPAVNQILINAMEMQQETVAINNEHKILSEAYSPIGTGKIFEIEELNEIAEKYGKTPAQIVLRWSLQHGFLPLPKTSTFERVKENVDIFDF